MCQQYSTSPTNHKSGGRKRDKHVTFASVNSSICLDYSEPSVKVRGDATNERLKDKIRQALLRRDLKEAENNRKKNTLSKIVLMEQKVSQVVENSQEPQSEDESDDDDDPEADESDEDKLQKNPFEEASPKLKQAKPFKNESDGPSMKVEHQQPQEGNGSEDADAPSSSRGQDSPDKNEKPNSIEIQT